MKNPFNYFATSLVFAAALATNAIADHHNKPVDLAGTWKATASSDEGEREFEWTFSKSKEGYTGKTKDLSGDEERKFDRIKVEEKTVTLGLDLEEGVIKVVAEEKEAGQLVGKWSIAGADGTEFGSGALTAKKEKKIVFAGEWAAVTVLGDGNELKSELTLKGANDKLEGAFASSTGSGIEIDKITSKDDGVRFEFDFEYQDNKINAVIEANLKDENSLDGKWIVIGDGGEETATGDWSAKRKVDPYAGTWNVTAKVPDRDDYIGTLTLARKDDGYAGKSASSEGEETDLNSVKIDGDKIELAYDFERGDFTGVITVKAEQKDGALVGKWTLAGTDGTEVASDAWKANKADAEKSEEKEEGLKGR
jgi:hypothetical protein